MKRDFSTLKSASKFILKLLNSPIIGVAITVGAIWYIPPLKNFIIRNIGSEIEKANLAYNQRIEKVKKDSVAKIQRNFEKGQKDSLAQAKKKNVECIRQEIDYAESNPCQSTLIYSIGGSWNIGSSKCSGWIAGEFHRGFPLALLNERWRYWNIGKYTHSVEASEINKILDKCP